jgi:hypothetical protein
MSEGSISKSLKLVEEDRPASKVLEMRSIHILGVTVFNVNNKGFISFSRLVVKSLRGSALNLSQPPSLPHGTSSHHGNGDTYISEFAFHMRNHYILLELMGIRHGVSKGQENPGG